MCRPEGSKCRSKGGILPFEGVEISPGHIIRKLFMNEMYLSNRPQRGGDVRMSITAGK